MNIDNILYFPNLVDVRLSPKCGWSSFHQLFNMSWSPKIRREKKTYQIHRHGPANWRVRQYWQEGDITDIPYRKNSIRFAVKRDPVKRFLSAVNYLQEQKINNICDRDYPRNGFSSLENVVSAMERDTLYNFHLIPQTFFYGEDKEKYHHIYDLNNLDECFLHIKDLCRSKKLDKYPVDKVHKNISNKTLSLEITDDLIKRIQTLYKIDYDNGWC
jgi:hypothetical protein